MTLDDRTGPCLCLAPRPYSRRPAFRLPEGTCDTHAHVFGSKFPLADGHGYKPHDLGGADYLRLLSNMGIARGVLVQPSVYRTDNSALLDALHQAPDILRGVAVLHPDIDAGAVRQLHEAGVRGIRVNRRNAGGLSLDAIPTLGRIVAPFGWHIQLQVQLAHTPDLAGIVAGCPVPVVIDHFGFPDMSPSGPGRDFASLLTLVEQGRVWVKMSAPYRVSRAGFPYSDTAPMVEALAACRPDRLLWGTDWPHTELWADMPDDADLIDATPIRSLTPDVQRAIFVANPAALYGFHTGASGDAPGKTAEPKTTP